jgi:hypothetical protein
MAHAFNIYITNCPERHPDDENNEGPHASTLGLITMKNDKAEIIPTRLYPLFSNIYEMKAVGSFDKVVCGVMELRGGSTRALKRHDNSSRC